MPLDYYTISNKYNQFQHGQPKMKAIKKAIESADSENDYQCSLKFRYDYIKEAIFYDDKFKALTMFPEYINIYDKYALFLDNFKSEQNKMIQIYEWILNLIHRFYQISNEKVMEYFEDFKIRIKENDYSIRRYYNSLSIYIQYIDLDEYKKVFKKYLNSPKDSSYCELCSKFDEIYFEIFYGDFEKAMKIAKPILNQKKNCGDNLEILYNNIIFYYVKNNIVEDNIKEISKYENLLCQCIKHNSNNLGFADTLMQYYAIADLNKGIKIFKKYLDWNQKIKTPIEKFNFENGAYTLFKSLKEKEDRKTIKLNLNESFPLYKEEGIYSLDEMINYFKNNIIELAEKFDKRNGNNYLMNSIKL